jgi:3-oxoacyl-[acyl-carrier-protein] synthase II
MGMHETALKLLSWDLLSPYGGKDAFLSAIAARQSVADTVSASQTLTIHCVPDFDVREQLGKKGTRNFDRHTGLFVHCANKAIEQAGLSAHDLMAAGIVNGTAAGSLSSIQDFLLDTYRLEQPYFVNPAHMPNTVINCAAGQCAIWHGIRGPNATVSAGSQSFQAAARMAGRWAANGFARHMLIGAVEEITPITANLLYAYCDRAGYLPGMLAEGAAVFLVEASARNALRDQDSAVLATMTRTATTTDCGTALRQLADDILQRAGLGARDVALVSLKSWRGSSSHQHEQRVAEHLGTPALSAAAIFGNGYSASGALQLALLLAELPAGGIGLTVSASRNGSIACQLVRKGHA